MVASLEAQHEIERIDDLLRGALFGRLPADRAHGLQVLRNHVLRIAGHQVRSVGTVGGNIMLTLGHAAAGNPFPSDLLTVLAVLDARVSLRRPSAPDDEETYPILELPPIRDFPEGFLLTSIKVPLTDAEDFVNTYKVARRAQNSHAIVNAGFVIRCDENRRVKRCRFVFGGLRPIAWRAEQSEKALIGQIWDQALTNRIQTALRDEIDALAIADFGDGISDPYRRSLANNLFYKFLVQFNLPDGSVDARFGDAGNVSVRPVSCGKHGTIAAPYVAGARDAERLVFEQNFAAPSKGLVPVESRSPSVKYDLEKSLPPGRPAPRAETVAKILADALMLERTSEVAELAPLPMVKLGAELQATGEARYTQDLSLPREPLACYYVLSQRSFARFMHPDPTPDLVERLRREFPGVRDYVTFVDIPKPSFANRYDPTDPGAYDPVFANVYVAAVGQPIGLILADSARTAQAAALRMQDLIAYDTTGLAAPVLTLDDALTNNSFLKDRSSLKSITRPGSETSWLDDPDPKPEEGTVLVSGTQATGAQAHFYFETQSVLAVPGEMDRMTIYSSSQNLGSCQGQVANALGIPTAKVEAKALRLGGGFGGKEVRAPYFAVAAAVAAWKVGEPVRLALDRNTDMRMVGKRHPFRGRFAVSAKADGKIDRIKLDFVADAGSSYDCTLPVTDLVLLSADSAYGVKTFRASRKACLTNTLTNTAMRSFGVIQCSLIVEEAIEKLAHKLGIAPETVREQNFYRDATVGDRDVTPYGQALMDCRINQVWSDFKRIVDFDGRAARIAEFNRTNRWRKRGISMIPIKYGISYTYTPSNESGADILVYANDGTVLVKHGGMEMGQGIHTKIARLAADALGIDIKYIEVAGTNTLDVANAPSTGASTGTDLNGGAAWAACAQLRERLVGFCKTADPPIADWETQWQMKWPTIVKAANAARVQLASQALFKSPDLALLDSEGQLKKPKPGDPEPRIFYYFTYSAAASEVEIDVLTGEHSIVRADIVYDSGKTINAGLDYGQIEGGFVQGVGNVTSEELYHANDGRLLADGTWNYKIPCSKSIPIEFNVYLLDYIPSSDAKTPLDTYGIRSAKSTGEPPLVLASSVFFAIKHAILAARQDAGSSDWFELESPATVERIQSACLVRPNDLVMKEP
jgi:xanthine dehydrogenase/oxidase